MALLKTGMSGQPVKILQEKLGVEADGVFGPNTEKALKAYQDSQNIAVDGIAGPDTFAHMGLVELILLRQGTKGETVKKLQEKLGIGADGIFGAGTAAAVKAYQEENGLQIDGLAGPKTLSHMKLFGIEETHITAAISETGKSIWDSITGIFK